jgi:hypothetical protein
MKITTKNKNKINRLLISELISFKIYNRTNKIKNKNHYNTNLLARNIFSSFNQISFNFKKMLQIIFKYHFNRRKILVIAEKPLRKKQVFYAHTKTSHVFTAKTSWIKGALSNNKTIQTFLKKKNPILKLIKKPRLIVFYNYCDFIDSESYARRITNVTLINEKSFKPKYFYSKNLTYFTLDNLIKTRREGIQLFFSKLIEKIIKLPKLNRKLFIFMKKKKRSKKNYYSKTNKRIKRHKKIYQFYDNKNNKKKPL